MHFPGLRQCASVGQPKVDSRHENREWRAEKTDSQNNRRRHQFVCQGFVASDEPEARPEKAKVHQAGGETVEPVPKDSAWHGRSSVHDILRLVRIRFDSICLAGVVAECQALVGSTFENAIQIDAASVVLTFWSGSAHWLLLSADASAPRAYLLTRRPEGLRPAPALVEEFKKRVRGARVRFVRQRGLDRILEIGMALEGDTFVVVAELMGKHSNVMLVDKNGILVGAVKWVGQSKSVRPILPGRLYAPPPFPERPSLLEAPDDATDLAEYEGASPFFVKLIRAGLPLAQAKKQLAEQDFHATFVPGAGAYPLDTSPLGLAGVPRSSFSQALEQHFETLVEAQKIDQVRSQLRSQLKRVLLAREVALHDVDEALLAARDARLIQAKGELILAYQSMYEPGSKTLSVWDYAGQPLDIAIKPDLTLIENAERYFVRAKKAKSRAGEMEQQRIRLESDRAGIEALLDRIEEAQRLSDIESLWQEADRNRWLQKSGFAKPKEERPFEGHAVRELLSPAGWRVLYGDNATSNDYLTSRVAKPADLWFHVRGAPSAHVVLCTNNQPQKVQKDDLEFAARLAVRHSPSKHSGYVSVDYTQKRYVRKPKGSPPGLAVYTHEKTIHVTEP